MPPIDQSACLRFSASAVKLSPPGAVSRRGVTGSSPPANAMVLATVDHGEVAEQVRERLAGDGQAQLLGMGKAGPA